MNLAECCKHLKEREGAWLLLVHLPSNVVSGALIMTTAITARLEDLRLSALSSLLHSRFIFLVRSAYAYVWQNTLLPGLGSQV